jgi:hypothetical protein
MYIHLARQQDSQPIHTLSLYSKPSSIHTATLSYLAEFADIASEYTIYLRPLNSSYFLRIGFGPTTPNDISLEINQKLRENGLVGGKIRFRKLQTSRPAVAA